MSLRTLFCLSIAIVCFQAASFSNAHVAESCLKLLEQSAQDLKHCVVKKKRENCRYDRQLLTDQVESCREQQFSDEEITHAIRVGESFVEGNASYYLEPSARDALNSAEMVAKGNVENFSVQFRKVKSFPVEDLYVGANMGGCHRAFLATGERYKFLGSFKFKRYNPEDIDNAVPHTIFFFNKMLEGVCYEAPNPGQTMPNGDRVVLNLPREFFVYLKRSAEIQDERAVTVICASEAECSTKKKKALELQVDYHASFLRLQRLKLCERQSKSNGVFQRMARFKITHEELPTHCMEETLDENIKSLSKTVNNIGRQLFDGL
ncbi:MAG: hypothetical protein MI867_25050 [Pseudomonadales bacterium]|nr:hypothetical protein [Pseudomonadales bacterium]